MDAILGDNRNLRELLGKVLSEAKVQQRWIEQISAMAKPLTKSGQVIRDLAKIGLNTSNIVLKDCGVVPDGKLLSIDGETLLSQYKVECGRRQPRRASTIRGGRLRTPPDHVNVDDLGLSSSAGKGDSEDCNDAELEEGDDCTCCLDDDLVEDILSQERWKKQLEKDSEDDEFVEEDGNNEEAEGEELKEVEDAEAQQHVDGEVLTRVSENCCPPYHTMPEVELYALAKQWGLKRQFPKKRMADLMENMWKQIASESRVHLPMQASLPEPTILEAAQLPTSSSVCRATSPAKPLSKPSTEGKVR
jgi:hypothetical protein